VTLQFFDALYRFQRGPSLDNTVQVERVDLSQLTIYCSTAWIIYVRSCVLHHVPLLHHSHTVAAEFEASTAPEWLAFVWPPTGNPCQHGLTSALRAFQLIGRWWLPALLLAVEWLVKRNASGAGALHLWNLSRLNQLMVSIRRWRDVWWGMWFLSIAVTNAAK
jgi:hypothetical protein